MSTTYMFQRFSIYPHFLFFRLSFDWLRIFLSSLFNVIYSAPFPCVICYLYVIRLRNLLVIHFFHFVFPLRMMYFAATASVCHSVFYSELSQTFIFILDINFIYLKMELFWILTYWSLLFWAAWILQFISNFTPS